MENRGLSGVESSRAWVFHHAVAVEMKLGGWGVLRRVVGLDSCCLDEKNVYVLLEYVGKCKFEIRAGLFIHRPVAC